MSDRANAHIRQFGKAIRATLIGTGEKMICYMLVFGFITMSGSSISEAGSENISIKKLIRKT